MSPIYVPGKVVLKKESVAADPYYNNVSLLLHGDGANGSTTFVDSSTNTRTATRTGNTQITTAQSKYGGASIEFGGNVDFLRINGNSNLAFGTGDFTIECWVRPTVSRKQFAPVIDFRTLVNGAFPTLLYYDTNGSIGYFVNNSTVISGGTLGLDAWSHLAVSRSGTSTRLFINGSQSGSTWTDTSNYQTESNGPVIGQNGLNSANSLFSFSGYIDELRITKGIARYTSNFAVPTAPFPEVLG